MYSQKGQLMPGIIHEGMTKRQIAEAKIQEMLDRRGGIEQTDLLAKAIYSFAGRSISEAFGRETTEAPVGEGEAGYIGPSSREGATGSGGEIGYTGGGMGG